MQRYGREARARGWQIDDRQKMHLLDVPDAEGLVERPRIKVTVSSEAKKIQIRPMSPKFRGDSVCLEIEQLDRSVGPSACQKGTRRVYG